MLNRKFQLCRRHWVTRNTLSPTSYQQTNKLSQTHNSLWINFRKIAIKSWWSSYNCIKKTTKTIVFHISFLNWITDLSTTMLYPFDLHRLTIMAYINCRWFNFIMYKVYPADNLYPAHKVSKLRWVCEIGGTILHDFKKLFLQSAACWVYD